tara:strand:- start:16166 stop:16450 length:285 start_codon:yes stop_codon:yes gene_type:complete
MKTIPTDLYACRANGEIQICADLPKGTAYIATVNDTDEYAGPIPAMEIGKLFALAPALFQAAETLCSRLDEDDTDANVTAAILDLVDAVNRWKR